MRLRGLVPAGAVGLLVALAGASPAAAAVTTSNVRVTSPAGTYVLDDQVTPNETITGAGTTNGTTGDKVDVNCYAGTKSRRLLANVPVASDGTFSFSGSLKNISTETCVLRAVPAGNTTDYAPGGSSRFSGPTLAIDSVANFTITGGPNAGKLKYYYIYGSQLRGGFDYGSLGGCSIDDSYTYDPVTFLSVTLDYCNAWFTYENGLKASPGVAPPTRSELQVDGADAYLAGNAQSAFGGSQNVPGYPSLTYTYSIDRTTGNLVVDELDQVVKCSPGGVYPPTAASCTSFVPTGVQVKMHITQLADGRMATVAQYLSSTDGRAHGVDLLENNEFRHVNKDGQLNFPWTGSGMTGYTTPGQVLAGPAAGGPGSFFIKGSASVPDGGEGSAQGATTFASPPDRVTVIAATNRDSWVDLHYARTVPASGSVALGFTYSNAFLASEVAGYARAAEASYKPAAAIGSGVRRKRQLVVSGTASDATGIASVVVNGKRGALRPGGVWTVRLPLRTKKVRVTATNVFGNSVQAVASATLLSRVSESHRRWRERGRGHRPPVGTTFKFRLARRATVTFVFMRRGVTAGTLWVKGHRGMNRRPFKGLLAHHRRLKAGRYTVVITATAGGVQSLPAKLTFTIVR